MFSIPECLRSAPQFGEREIRALQCLTKEEDLTEAEIRFLTEFLEMNIGSRDLNKRLSRAIKRNQEITRVSRDAMKLLKQYTFKSQNLDRMAELTGRATDNLADAQGGEEIAPERRLSLRQLRKLEGFAKFHATCEQLRERGVDPTSGETPKLERLFTEANRAHDWKELFVAEMDERMPATSRDIIGYSFKYYEEYRGISIPWIAKWWCTKVLGYPVNHLAIGFRDHRWKENHESHMWGEERQDNLSVHLMQRKRHLGNYINPTFRVNVERIVNEEYADRIADAYQDDYSGKSWQEIVAREYDLASEKWHVDRSEDHTLEQLRNPALKRMLVALYVNTVGLFSRPWRERAQFEDDVFRYGTEVSCSEFGLKASLQTMDLLGQRLAEKLGLTEAEAEAIITPPFDESRRFQRYSPSKIIARGLELGIFEGNDAVEVPDFYRSQVAY